jgi:hypothetical protein
MAKRVSKASLIRRIESLEAEIDAIHEFHAMRLQMVSREEERKLRGKEGFVPVACYAYRYCLHPGEIGRYAGVRYRKPL